MKIRFSSSHTYTAVHQRTWPLDRKLCNDAVQCLDVTNDTII